MTTLTLFQNLMSASMLRRLRLATCGAALLAPLSLRAQTINLGPASPATYTTGILSSSFPAVGQTFVAPTGAALLLDFHFWLSASPDFAFQPEAVNFNAYIAQWDAVSGAASAPIQIGGTVMGTASQEYVSAPMNYTVTPGATYIAFLSALGVATNADAYAAIEMSDASYADGALVFTDGAITDPWFENGSSQMGSARFTANFSQTSTVPEPSSVLLVAVGMGGIALVARRRISRGL